jgi:hypothetical protein
MENNSTNVLQTEGSGDIETAGKTRERETNAPDLFKAPQAAEEREANALPEGDRQEHGDTGNQSVGEGDRRC